MGSRGEHAGDRHCSVPENLQSPTFVKQIQKATFRLSAEGEDAAEFCSFLSMSLMPSFHPVYSPGGCRMERNTEPIGFMMSIA